MLLDCAELFIYLRYKLRIRGKIYFSYSEPNWNLSSGIYDIVPRSVKNYTPLAIKNGGTLPLSSVHIATHEQFVVLQRANYFIIIARLVFER